MYLLKKIFGDYPTRHHNLPRSISPVPPPPTEPIQLKYYKGLKTRMQLGTGSKYRWRIDAGHGKFTRGKRSPRFWFGNVQVQFFEYEFNRRVIEHLFYLLEQDGTMDFIELVPEHSIVGNMVKERANRLNRTYSRRDRGVSIHSNAGANVGGGWCDPTASGIEVWHYDNSKKGVPMAQLFLNELVSEFGWKNRGLKASPSERSLYIVNKSRCPMILLEIGFFNNKKQVHELMRIKTALRAAAAIFAAMKEYEKKN